MIMLIGAYSMSVIVYVAALRLRKNGGPDYLGLCQLNAIYGARLGFPALHDRDTLFLNHMLSPPVFSHDHFVRKMVRIFAYLACAESCAFLGIFFYLFFPTTAPPPVPALQITLLIYLPYMSR